MSDIQVGDLVMMVRACCERRAAGCMDMGIPWKVTGFSAPALGYCSFCGKTFPGIVYAGKAPHGKDIWVGWLRRIPPLSELEKTEERIKEKV